MTIDTDTEGVLVEMAARIEQLEKELVIARATIIEKTTEADQYRIALAEMRADLNDARNGWELAVEELRAAEQTIHEMEIREAA